MTDSYLGEFEHLILLAIVRLGDEAYGVPIRRTIEERAERAVSFGAVYSTLRTPSGTPQLTGMRATELQRRLALQSRICLKPNPPEKQPSMQFIDGCGKPGRNSLATESQFY